MSSLNALLSNHEDVSSLLIPEHIRQAPQNIRTRVAALKKLQLKTVEVQSDFYKRVHELETEFRSRLDDVNKQREAIVSGKYEPGENESNEKIFSWMDDEQLKKFNETVPADAGGDQTKIGIPDFWLNVLRSVPGVGELISGADEPILRHLTDITVDQTNEPPAFTLKFHFNENEYFTNQVLTKYYKLSIGPNGFETEVLYDGPSIVETKGCEIDWKEGKNVTEKTIKKKPKKGNAKLTTKVVPAESFFRFFKPEVEKVEKDLPDESAELLNGDFEAGQMIRDSVIDAAILYYTGESMDDDEFGDYGAEDEDGEFGDGTTDDEE